MATVNSAEVQMTVMVTNTVRLPFSNLEPQAGFDC